jgi:hypothetical protein
MGFVTPLVTAFGGQWFDNQWRTKIDTPEWRRAHLLVQRRAAPVRPAGRDLQRLQRNLAPVRRRPLRHVDRRHRGGGAALRPEAEPGRPTASASRHADRRLRRRADLAVELEPGDPRHLEAAGGGARLRRLGHVQEYIQLVARENGWVAVPPGTRRSTYDNPEVPEGQRPSRPSVLRAINDANPTGQHARAAAHTAAPPISWRSRFPGHRPEVRGRRSRRRLTAPDNVEQGPAAARKSATEARYAAGRQPEKYRESRGQGGTTGHVHRRRPRRRLCLEPCSNPGSAAARVAFILLSPLPGRGPVLWMIVPLAMTLWFSFQHYNLLNPAVGGFAGLDNYEFLVTDPDFWDRARQHAGAGGLGAGDHRGGRHAARRCCSTRNSPAATSRGCWRSRRSSSCPTVSALVWKNLMLHPIYGVLGLDRARARLGAGGLVRRLPDVRLVIVIVAWQWLPFALLILLTAVQSLDHEQKEAARMDGAGPVSQFFFITLPHLGRAISVVVMIETIFLLPSSPRSSSPPPADRATPRRTSPS